MENADLYSSKGDSVGHIEFTYSADFHTMEAGTSGFVWFFALTISIKNAAD